MTIKVLELRNYLLKSGTRDRFAAHFAEYLIESQNALGGHVLGQYTVEDEPDRFFWLRGFVDMEARSKFLPAFYGGDVWKQHGPAANEMMIDWKNVHLIKPLEKISVNHFNEASEITIQYLIAKEGRLNELAVQISDMRENRDITFWTSETEENDFPRLPVFQDENLLAAIERSNTKQKFHSDFINNKNIVSLNKL